MHTTTGRYKTPRGQKGRIFKCTMNKAEVRQAGSGTGNLACYLRRHFPILHDKYVVDSSAHTNKKRSADGSTYEIYSFKEAAPHHVKFVFMCARDKRPPHMGQSKGFREFASSLNKRYVPPSYKTVKRLGLCALNVMRRKKRLLYAKVRYTRNHTIASTQLPLFSVPMMEN